MTILKLVEKDIVLGDEKKNRAGARRDAIAKAMWEDYCDYYGRRR